MNVLELSKELCAKGVIYEKISYLRNLMISGPPHSERKSVIDMQIWLQLTGASWQLIDNPGYYEELLESKKSEVSASTVQIDKDIDRTFATESYFINKKNLKKLRNILITYSWRNEAIGYCQGMNFIVARLLNTGFSEEVNSK